MPAGAGGAGERPSPATPGPARPYPARSDGGAHRLGPALAAAAAAGVVVALQARIHGAFTERVGSAIVVGLVSFCVGLLSLLVVVTVTGRWQVAGAVRRARAGSPFVFLGGLGGAFFVTTAASAVPVIGVALLGVCIVAGQLAGSLVVDGLGLGPSGRHPVTAPRVVGSALALSGVGLSLLGERVELRPLVVGMVVVAGAAGALQQAANGHVQRHVGDIWVVSLVNFAVGTVGMLLVTWVFVVARGVELGSWPGNPMLYVGGLCGVFFVAVAAATVRLLGVLRLTLAVVAGQLTGGLLLDVVAPSAGRPGIQLVAGVAVVFAAVAVAARPDKRAGTPPARP